MTTNNFQKLFIIYGYKVEQLTERSYIADNGLYCVAFTETPRPNGIDSLMCGVSFLSEDKELIKKSYPVTDKHGFPSEIGYEVWSDYMNDMLSRKGLFWFGGIANHDYSAFEVEDWLKRTNGDTVRRPR